jgi:hypothetical protein
MHAFLDLSAGSWFWQIATVVVLLAAVVVIAGAAGMLCAVLLRTVVDGYGVWKVRRARRRVAALDAEMDAERLRLRKAVVAPDLRQP